MNLFLHLPKRSFFLCSCLFFSCFFSLYANVWNGTRNASWNTTGSPLSVNSAEDLAQLAYLVNTGVTFAGKTINLTTDLDLNGSNFPWIPVGATSYAFQGIFNGQSHAISNVSVNSATYTYCGLFGNVSTKRYYAAASVANLNLSNVNIVSTSTGTAYAGGLIGSTDGTNGAITITNCTVNSGVVAGKSTSIYCATGGLIGVCFAANSISSCSASATVTSVNGDSGGLIGSFQSAGNTTLSNCSSNGNCSSIVSEGLTGIGGLIGWIYPNTSVAVSGCNSTSTISGITSYMGDFIGCLRTGTISNCNATGSVTGQNYAGGFVGQMTGGNITNCTASGIASGQQYAGGFVGYQLSANSLTPSITYCSASGKVVGNANSGGFAGQIDVGTITNCYGAGTVTGVQYAGGFVGYQKGGSISSSYTLSQISTQLYAGGFVGLGEGGTVADCYSVGVTSGDADAGGFIGYQSGTAISNSYAAGNVHGGTCGGFVGFYSSGSLSSCVYDRQGTGQPSSYGAVNVSPPAGITSLTTAQLTAATKPASLGGTNWTIKSGYYPQLTSIYNYSSYPEFPGWSALSVLPLYMGVNSDHTNNVNVNFTSLMQSAPGLNSNVVWNPLYQPADKGRMNFIDGETFWLTHLGTATFTATDASNRVKNFYVNILHLPFARYFVNNTAGVGLDNTCNHGFNWTVPFKTLQFAIDQAIDTNQVVQIWVAKGTGSYIPTKDVSGASVPGSVAATFPIKYNVSIYGGFAGNQATEYSSNEATMLSFLQVRNFKANTTVLSGNNTSYSVFNYNADDADWDKITIDGFTVNGALSGTSAVAIPPGGNKINNCIIMNNGGDGLTLNSKTTSTNLLVAENGGNGVNIAGLNCSLTNATIANNANYAITVPGGIGSATLTNSIIWGNKANFDALADTAKITATYTALSTASASNDIPLNKWISFANGTGNINLFHRSPNFKKRKGNYELQLISPCLDAGLLSANSQPIDVYGRSRSYSGKIDMGAIQKQSGDGIYANSGTNTFSYFRAAGTPTLSNLTGQEVLVKPVSVINLGGSTTVKPKTLFIQDDNTTAPIIYNGSIKADSTLYLRKLTKYRSNGVAYWTFMGFPFTSVRLDSIDGLKIENSVRADQYTESIRAINGANKSAWKPYMGTDLNNPSLKWFVPGRGYAASLNAKVPDKTVSTTLIIPAQKGTTISDATATLTAPVSYTETSRPWYDKGWNLIANPFARTAKFGSVPLWEANPYTSGSIWLYIADQDAYDVIPTVSSYYTDNGLSAYGTFFIQTYSTATSASTAEISTSGNGTAPLRTRAFPFSTTNETKPEVFRVHLEGNGLKYNTYVIFNDSARTEATAIEDAPTMGGLSGNSIQMSTYAAGSDLALSVNTLPFKGTSMEVPLSVSISQQGSYTFSLQESSKFKTVYLVDPAGTSHNISKGNYTTNVDSTGSFSYKLIFEKKDESHDKENLLEKWGIHIFETNGNVIISSNDPLLRIYLFRMNQQLVRAMANCGTNFQFHLPFPGAYMVRVTTKKGTFSQIVVKH